MFLLSVLSRLNLATHVPPPRIGSSTAVTIEYGLARVAMRGELARLSVLALARKLNESK